MNTNYYITFTEDNQIIFNNDMKITDESFADIPVTRIVIQDEMLDFFKPMIISVYHIAILNNRLHNIKINENLLKLCDMVNAYTGGVT